MDQYNGSSMGLGIVLGELRAEARYQTQILTDISDKLEALPSQLSTAIATPTTSSGGRILPELTELIRTLYPVLILLAALVGKSAIPETGLLQAVVTAVIGGILS
jgi:hypothetical protein